MSDVNMLLLRRRAMMMQNSAPSDNCLTFTAETAGVTVQLKANNTPPSVLLEYNLDGAGWMAYTVGDTITLPNVGSTLKMRGSNAAISNASGYHQFVIGVGNAALSGSITSLMDNVGGDVVLGARVFYRLFYNQSRLTGEAVIPSTSLGNYCLGAAFLGTSITSATLHATTTVSDCYRSMFNNCVDLAYIKTFMTDISAGGLTGWLGSVAATGDFYCDPSLNIPSGANGIPSGWTRYNLDGTPYNE